MKKVKGGKLKKSILILVIILGVGAACFQYFGNNSGSLFNNKPHLSDKFNIQSSLNNIKENIISSTNKAFKELSQNKFLSQNLINNNISKSIKNDLLNTSSFIQTSGSSGLLNAFSRTMQDRMNDCKNFLSNNNPYDIDKFSKTISARNQTHQNTGNPVNDISLTIENYKNKITNLSSLIQKCPAADAKCITDRIKSQFFPSSSNKQASHSK